MNCSTHAAAPASNQCTQCHRLLCTECVRRIKAGTGFLEACAKCNGVAGPAPARVPTGPVAVGELLARPFSSEGLFTAGTLGVVKWIQLGYMHLFGGGAFVSAMGALFTAGVVAFYFRIIAHIGQELPGLPGASDAVDSIGEVVSQTLRGMLCLGVGCAPLLAWWFLRDDSAAIGAGGGAAVVLLLCLGMAYMPAALLTIVLTDSTLGALYPPAWIKLISAAPLPYARFAGLFVVSALAILAGTLVLGVLSLIPFIGGFLFGTGQALMFFAQACLVGGFLRRHAEDFGY